MNQNIIVIIKSHFKPFQVERIEKRQFIYKKMKNLEIFSEVKCLGHLKGNLTEIFFLHFYNQNDLILKIEQKNFFRKNFFLEKKFPGPAKMAVFGHISAKKVFLDMRFSAKVQI